MMHPPVSIIGGGLAGCEAAWQLAGKNIPVVLYDMKPVVFSPAHKSENLAELVCSNSLRSNDPFSAVGLLKDEMRQLNSLIITTADKTSVPAGKALAVDRDRFSKLVSASGAGGGALPVHPLLNPGDAAPAARLYQKMQDPGIATATAPCRAS